jgi:divalent metal cation (Fe/Co/Zn/Cd) transporter
VSSDADLPSVRFQPLRPASRGRLLAAFVFGPLLWLAALAVVAWLFVNSTVIVLGLLVAAASFVISLVVLAGLYAGRRREERRYVDSR